MFDPGVMLQVVAIGLLGWNLRQTHLLTVDVRIMKDREKRKDRRNYVRPPDPDNEVIA